MVLVLNSVWAPLWSRRVRAGAIVACSVAVIMLVACGGSSDSSGETTAGSDRPTVVVTTTILGDVVANVLGDQAQVVTVMAAGVDPHDFQPSAQQVAAINDADLVVVNGGSLEEGLVDVVDAAAADGVPVFSALDTTDTLDYDRPQGDEHGDEDHDDEHGDEDHDDEHGDDHHHGEGVDAHFFTDPTQMIRAVEGLVAFVSDDGIEGIDVDVLERNARTYRDELVALDKEIESLLDAVPSEERVLVTNHESFGYFAARYDFEVVGIIISGGATGDAVSAAELVDLTETIRNEGVEAIFAETTTSSDLAETLAAEVGQIAVVELFSDSLGAPDSDAASYVAMMRTNAQRVAEALRS